MRSQSSYSKTTKGLLKLHLVRQTWIQSTERQNKKAASKQTSVQHWVNKGRLKVVNSEGGVLQRDWRQVRSSCRLRSRRSGQMTQFQKEDCTTLCANLLLSSLCLNASIMLVPHTPQCSTPIATSSVTGSFILDEYNPSNGSKQITNAVFFFHRHWKCPFKQIKKCTSWLGTEADDPLLALFWWAGSKSMWLLPWRAWGR